MSRPYRSLAAALVLALTLCGVPEVGGDVDPHPIPGRATAAVPAPSVTYVHKISDITDFTGYGEYGYYFPLFGRTSWDDERKTDSGMVFYNPYGFGWEFDIRDGDRTFSPDAGPFGNCCSTKRIGVYTAGGNLGWDRFVLPNGLVGFAGTTVDEAARNNTNQSINRIEIGSGTPSSFCLRILQDSTNRRFDSDGTLTARARAGGRDHAASVPASDHTYDGSTDMYTFRYENLYFGDFIKIKFRGIDKDPGFSGILFDPVEACPDPPVAVMALGPGDGTRQLPEGETTSLPLTPGTASRVAEGDFDGNGTSDYVVSWDEAQPDGSRQSVYMNGHTWVGLHELPGHAYAVGDLDGNGQDDLAVDLGAAHALSVWMNASEWVEISSDRADVIETVDLDGNASQELVASFPGVGNPLKIYWNGASWSDLHPLEARDLDAGRIDDTGVEDLVASFDDGLWVYEDDTSWRPIHPVPPAITDVVDLNGNGQADVVATWPDAACGGEPCGIQVNYDAGGPDDWTQLHARTPNAFAAGDVDGSPQGDLMVSWEGGLPISTYLNDAGWVQNTADAASARSLAVRAFRCGDNLCQAGETSCDCPRDCPVVAGDGCCDGGEVSCTEPACPVVEGDGCCDYGATEVCESPDCICPEVTMGTWEGFRSHVYDHVAPAGRNRVLVFVVHGVRGDGMHVDGVHYGGQPMARVLQQQAHHNRHALVAIFYLGEVGIARAESRGRADFFVDWNGEPAPDRRRYESVFFFDADRGSPIGQYGSSSHTSQSYIQTALGLVEAGHMSFYAATHEDCVAWFPMRDYIPVHQGCGGRSSSVGVAYKDGHEATEWPGAWVTSSDAIVLGAVEIRRYWHGAFEPLEAPQCTDGVDNDEDGLVDFGADPECTDPLDDLERPLCGLGFELALLLPLLMATARRAHRSRPAPR